MTTFLGTLSWYFGAVCFSIVAIALVAAVGYVPNHNGIWVEEGPRPPQIEVEGRIVSLLPHCKYKYTPASGRPPNYPVSTCAGGASQLARTYPPGSFEEVKRFPMAQVEFRTGAGVLQTVTLKPADFGLRPDAQAGDQIRLAYNVRNPTMVEKPAAKGLPLLGHQVLLIAGFAICVVGAIGFVWRVGFG